MRLIARLLGFLFATGAIVFVCGAAGFAVLLWHYQQDLPDKRVQGASTITQQVAKNFLLTNERSFERKIREMLLSFRIEAAYSKERILELYLNEIYLGLGNYGIAASALNYYGRSVNELTLAEAAYLAALPKAPSDLHPFRNRDKAIARRNYVIDRMVENGYVARAVGDKAKTEPLGVSIPRCNSWRARRWWTGSCALTRRRAFAAPCAISA